MQRRELLALLASGALAWSFQAGAQPTRRPVIGFLHGRARAMATRLFASFKAGLATHEFRDGENVIIDDRWADGNSALVQQHAAGLVERKVDVIVATGGLPVAIAAKRATDTIPVLFIAGTDPEHPRVGLVSSLSRPSGNATGVSVDTTSLMAKRLELLLEVARGVRTVAVLTYPEAYSLEFERQLAGELERNEAQVAAQLAGVRLLVLAVADDAEIEPQLTAAVRDGAGALLVSADPFFTERRARIVALAEKLRLPAVYPLPPYAEAGGLISYGPNILEAYRQIGDYTGRILKGTRPQDLPVLRPSSFDFIINLKAAHRLGFTVPEPLLSTASRIIE